MLCTFHTSGLKPLNTNCLKKKFLLVLQCEQSLGRGSVSWRRAIRTVNQTSTWEAPLCAARLKSTSVTYMSSTDRSGEFCTLSPPIFLQYIPNTPSTFDNLVEAF